MSSQARPAEVLLDVAELRRRALLRLVDRFRVVKWLMAPMMIGLMSLILYVDPQPWRLAVVATAVVVSLAVGARFSFGSAEGIARFCARDFQPAEALPFSAVQLLLLTASGGLASPLLPITFAATYNAGLFGGRAAARAVFACHIAGLWALLAVQLAGVDIVPRLLFDAGQPDARFLVASAVAMTMALSAAHIMGLRTRGAVDDQLRHALSARAVALANYRERTDELTTLSAEIAHELKNPLATVKGLAALLGRDAEGKAAERLAVLRREVDRMQGILEEFLNFSRPLAPLTVRRVDVARLVTDVVELHEGIASDRRIPVLVDPGPGGEVSCDPRKIKQILVNLLQNALDAAAPETPVDLVVRREQDMVVVQVLDRGAGVPAELAERIFEAGVTTKPHGNGLGLPMARALARQHGGDLELRPRGDGSGCAAILRLPVDGPALADAATPAARAPVPDDDAVVLEGPLGALS